MRFGEGEKLFNETGPLQELYRGQGCLCPRTEQDTKAAQLVYCLPC